MKETKSTGIALALSGGGTRAMAFHAGVLRFLAEKKQFEKISQISTVSGGSLLAGYIFSKCNMKWPTSTVYQKEVWPGLRTLLTTYDLQISALGRLIFRPENWKYGLSRANIVAQAIYEDWKVKKTLYDLPAIPIWSINGTTAETGRRFRFKYDEFGDYELGYAEARDFLIAEAMAVSAAFPVGIGPLSIKARKYNWKKRRWGASKSEAVSITLPYKSLHIYDGGVYDNLGLEPFYDSGKKIAKVDLKIIACELGCVFRIPSAFSSRQRFLGNPGIVMLRRTAVT
jgi:NTE family protein